eukprot:965518-Prymnesium_polylepis.1
MVPTCREGARFESCDLFPPTANLISPQIPEVACDGIATEDIHCERGDGTSQEMSKRPEWAGCWCSLAGQVPHSCRRPSKPYACAGPKAVACPLGAPLSKIWC